MTGWGDAGFSTPHPGQGAVAALAGQPRQRAGEVGEAGGGGREEGLGGHAKYSSEMGEGKGR